MARPLTLTLTPTLTPTPTQVELAALWHDCDINGTGAVNVIEFCARLFPDVHPTAVYEAASAAARQAVAADFAAERRGGCGAADAIDAIARPPGTAGPSAGGADGGGGGGGGGAAAAAAAVAWVAASVGRRTASGEEAARARAGGGAGESSDDGDGVVASEL